MAEKKIGTKTDIIKQASKLFASKGFESTTFADVAKKCGISQPAIYNHFNNKMDLLKGCVLEAWRVSGEYIDGKVEVDLPADEKLRLNILANLEWFHTDRFHANSDVALYYFANSDKELRRLYDDIVAKAIARIRSIIIQGERETFWKVQDADYLARIIHSLLVGEIYKVLYSKAEENVEVTAERLWLVVKGLLVGAK